jgi:hypothetical protein
MGEKFDVESMKGSGAGSNYETLVADAKDKWDVSLAPKVGLVDSTQASCMHFFSFFSRGESIRVCGKVCCRSTGWPRPSKCARRRQPWPKAPEGGAVQRQGWRQEGAWLQGLGFCNDRILSSVAQGDKYGGNGSAAPATPKQDLEKVKCFKCKQFGHMIKDCPQHH